MADRLIDTHHDTRVDRCDCRHARSSGTSSTNARFDDINARFDDVNTGLARIESRIQGLDDRVRSSRGRHRGGGRAAPNRRQRDRDGAAGAGERLIDSIPRLRLITPDYVNPGAPRFAPGYRGARARIDYSARGDLRPGVVRIRLPVTKW